MIKNVQLVSIVCVFISYILLYAIEPCYDLHFLEIIVPMTKVTKLMLKLLSSIHTGHLSSETPPVFQFMDPDIQVS